MRIIAGRLGGRQFASPHGHRTHPMSDKVRGAIFNALGDVSGLSALDGFAGSGALSLEAISRGASRAIAIDNDRNAQRAIAENIQALGLSGQVKLIKAGARSWLGRSSQTFDLVFLDPPYDRLQPETVISLAERARPGGLVICSLPPGVPAMLGDGFEQLLDKQYGDASVVIYRKIS